MNRARYTFLALLAATLIPSSARAQGGIQYDKIEIKTDKVSPNLYMLSGSEHVDPGHPDGAGGASASLPDPTASSWSTRSTCRLATRCWRPSGASIRDRSGFS